MQLNKNQEIFKAINGFQNYEISSFGRVRNVQTGRMLKQTIGTTGYYLVKIYKDGVQYTRKVHRLVATFWDNPNNYKTVDHIDRNPLNNYYQNLRWANQSQQEKNKGLRSTNKSGIKGVCFKQKRNCWTATISDNNGKKLYQSFSAKKYPDAFERCSRWRKQKEVEYNYNQ